MKLMTWKNQMIDQYMISKNKKLLASENYEFLRKSGLEHITKLAGKIWTDYNTHDPGITILELLCYAITDLGYRTSYDIKDILAPINENDANDEACFYTAAEIFPNNPVTILDFRKIIADIPGIKNAWLKKSNKYEKYFYVDYENRTLTFDKGNKNEIVELNGLYNIVFEFEKDIDEKDIKFKPVLDKLEKKVLDKLHEQRNLCEDYISIKKVDYEDIAVCADIEVKQGADVDTVLAEIYYNLTWYFSPQINFYSFDEMLKKGKTVDEIFEGPILEHGFLDNDEFEKTDLKSELRVSDIINFIMDIKDVVAVKNILLTSYIDNMPYQTNVEWLLELSGDNRVAQLNIDKSKFVFYKNILPYIANEEKVKKKLKEFNEFNRKYKLKGHKKDLPIPKGDFKNIKNYYPVQNSFPLCYGIGEFGLPKSASPMRKVQAKQLKAFLLFFEQLLANYLSQLANVKNLFSFDESISQTYFSQELYGIKDLKNLYLDYNTYRNDHSKLDEDKNLFCKRRNKFLDHLLGRFCEEITDYSLLLYTMIGENASTTLIKNKIDILKVYDEISANRGKAFNYKNKDQIWNTDNISGMKKRVCRLLGFKVENRQNLATGCLFIEKDLDKYVVILKDPENPEKEFLTSISYQNKEKAENILHYILSHGDNEENYGYLENGSNRFYLKDDCGELIATSQPFAELKERDLEKEKIITFFKRFCDIEGFHLIEHILLRPKSETDSLLPICIEEKEEEKNGQGKSKYKFEIFKDEPKAAGRKFEWRFRLRDEIGDIILRSEGYTRLHNCKKGIRSVRGNASDLANFKVQKAVNGKYYCNLVAANYEIVATSSDFYKTEKQLWDRIKDIQKFVMHEEIEPAKKEDICKKVIDPYSFRISIILPSWPEKFRNFNFRRFVEKTIRMETPAHIFPRICWIDLKQMQDFEIIYKKWLEELTKKETPDSEVLNEFIRILFNLKNVYPAVKLHDCEYADGDEPQVILNHSTLGII